MARLFLVLLFVRVASSWECDYDHECSGSERCCSSNICQYCNSYCVADSDCIGLWQQCCPNGSCIDSSATCDEVSRLAWGVIVAITVSIVVFISIIAAIIACCFCASCPLHSRRRGVVLVQGQPYNRFGTTVTTTTTTAQAGMPPQGLMYQSQPGPYPAQQGPYQPQTGPHPQQPPPYAEPAVKQ